MLITVTLALAAGCDDPDALVVDAEGEVVDIAGDGPDTADPQKLGASAADGDEPPDRSGAADQRAFAAPAAPPEEAGAPCRILALGDSITYGWNSNPAQEGDPTGTYHGGYRAHLVAGFVQVPSPTVGPIKMVGALVEHSTPLQVAWGQAAHSGYSGYTNAGIAWTVGTLGSSSFNPDIILLHSGTNDIRLSGWPQHATALANLNVLLENLRVKNPGATILMAKIIPMTGAYAYLNSEVNAYNAQLDGVAAARQAIGQDVRIVDHNTFFPTATILDGLHPDWTGYANMAARWRLALDAAGC
ncbi:GDSL-type esterase/lipase family protein [Nannocystis punicea]|uniref:GDSL-type esterase/lipase family protein n=1 Tax=Nannocystis punicea TaxID=2995304 RepID=A0ABY7GVS1_9BACT|nr:GDSL-type esterase/lipase family protein [Nannocystis poenicansa]WAS90994.1 GDSL-type esterase/lipase family protein [Nannocystis poenicansa]